MNKEDIRTLIEKYYRAETSLEEEERLRVYFSDPENHEEDPELADLLMLYGKYEETMFEGEISVSSPREQKLRSLSVPWYYSVAAAVAFLLVGVFAGKTWERNENNARELATLNKEVKELKSMVSYQQIENMSPGERIQVAYQFKEQDSLDRETVDALIDILQFDENTNVRLAAADALSKFKNNDRVRSAFLKALKAEENPLLQIKLIDALILSREIKAIPELQRIMKASDQNEAVKERAAYGLSQLI